MKQNSRRVYPVPAPPGLSVFAALVLILAVTPKALVHCDDQATKPAGAIWPSWQGSASVDSSQGTSLHLRVAHEGSAVAMSMIHESLGTAAFPGLTGETLDEVSIGLNLDSPFLVAGDLGLAGLGSFMFRPAGTGPLLPLYGRKPLQAERPDGTRYRGFVLGNEGGLMAVHPVSDPSRITSGAWFAPAGSPVSVMLLAGSEPGQVSDDWYKADKVQTDRLWGAASLGMSHKGKLQRMSLSGALAASAGLPGPDGMAGRLEAMLAIKRLRLDAEASLASEGWRAPDGIAAVPARFDLSALYRYRGLELSGAYRQVLKASTDEGPETGLKAHVQLIKREREFRLASSLTQAAGQSLPALTVDSRWKPGLLPAVLPGLAFETSWRSKDGLSERFDALASLGGGRTLRWSMGAGLRYDTQGRHVKTSASVLAPLGGSSLRFGLKSDGWIPLEGELPEPLLVLTITWRFSSP